HCRETGWRRTTDTARHERLWRGAPRQARARYDRLCGGAARRSWLHLIASGALRDVEAVGGGRGHCRKRVFCARPIHHVRKRGVRTFQPVHSAKAFVGDDGDMGLSRRFIARTRHRKPYASHFGGGREPMISRPMGRRTETSMAPSSRRQRLAALVADRVAHSAGSLALRNPNWLGPRANAARHFVCRASANSVCEMAVRLTLPTRRAQAWP